MREREREREGVKELKCSKVEIEFFNFKLAFHSKNTQINLFASLL